MRRLLPEPADDVDLVDAYMVNDLANRERPLVRCNMISTLDGAISVSGRSGALGGLPDRNVFQTIRSLADVVVVGAGTARAENYGPARLADQHRRERTGRGQPPTPPIAIVTGSGNLDWSSPFFAEAEARPLVFTTSDSDHGARRRGEQVAEVLIAGEHRVDPRRMLDHLARLGHRLVLLEGGPGLNGDVMSAGLLDELCLTIAPRLVAGDGPRVLAGPALSTPLDLAPVHLLEEDGFLFARLAVTGSAARSVE